MPPSCTRNNPDFDEILNAKNTVQGPSWSQETGKDSMAERGHEIQPHENDILMGRGGKNNQHVGNEKLRGFARLESENYRMASKKGKSFISRELVKKVRLMDPPGRFLKKNNATGAWEDVGDDVAREKASQVLRDAVSILSQPSPSNKNQNKNLHDSIGDISSDVRRSASAPPILKQMVRRRHWEEARYRTSQQHIMPNDFYLPIMPSLELDPSSKRPRYHIDTWDERLARRTNYPTPVRHSSSQFDRSRSHSSSPRTYSRTQVREVASKPASDGSMHTSLDEFELFHGELLNSDGEANDSDSELSLNVHRDTF
mmetsp:Transcript_6421/g.6984  ORF Transcript_6421/g.6984 Transcript_6421/m.6984 type:complete len:314 (-) Transcript_6421:47-988(-)